MKHDNDRIAADAAYAEAFRELESTILDLQDMAEITLAYVMEFFHPSRAKREDDSLHLTLSRKEMGRISFALYNVCDRAEELSKRYNEGYDAARNAMGLGDMPRRASSPPQHSV